MSEKEIGKEGEKIEKTERPEKIEPVSAKVIEKFLDKSLDKVEEKVEKADSPFISDDDLFDVSVDYYKDGKKIIVKGVDDTFDDTRKQSNITFKIKYPSQADCEIMFSKGREGGNFIQEGEVDIRNFYRMEVLRFLALIRSWSDVRELNNKNVMDLHPNIIRAALLKVRDELSTTGII